VSPVEVVLPAAVPDRIADWHDTVKPYITNDAGDSEFEGTAGLKGSAPFSAMYLLG
jgi:hypothetical protein